MFPAGHDVVVEIPIGGLVQPGFESMRDVFHDNWTPAGSDPGELGASLCVIVGGRVVVDLWGGWCDPPREHTWQRDTLVNAYSVGKGLSATAVLALVDRGVLDLDEPLAQHWPGFAAHGKGDLTLRAALSHRAGLPCARRKVEVAEAFDFHAMAGILAGTEPWWSPGEAHGYHVNTLGHLIGEPASRATGHDFDVVVRDEVALRCGADIHLGLPADQHHRLADIHFPRAELFDPTTAAPVAGGPTERADSGGAGSAAASDTDPPEPDLSEMRAGAYFNPPELSGIGAVNTPAFRSAVIPSTNMACTAAGVARVYASLSGQPPADSELSLSSGLIAEATTTHSDGDDLVLGRPSRFGLGYMLHTPERPVGITEESFGHFGHGGSLGFADRSAGVGFCYLTNRPGDRWQMPRTRRLISELGSLLGC